MCARRSDVGVPADDHDRVVHVAGDCEARARRRPSPPQESGGASQAEPRAGRGAPNAGASVFVRPARGGGKGGIVVRPGANSPARGRARRKRRPAGVEARGRAAKRRRRRVQPRRREKPTRARRWKTALQRAGEKKKSSRNRAPTASNVPAPARARVQVRSTGPRTSTRARPGATSPLDAAAVRRFFPEAERYFCLWRERPRSLRRAKSAEANSGGHDRIDSKRKARACFFTAEKRSGKFGDSRVRRSHRRNRRF